MSSFVNRLSYMNYVRNRVVLGIIAPFVMIVALGIIVNSGVAQLPVALNLLLYGVVVAVLIVNIAWYLAYLHHVRFFRLLQQKVPRNDVGLMCDTDKVRLTAQRVISSDHVFHLMFVVKRDEVRYYTFSVDRYGVRSNVEHPPLLMAIIEDGELVGESTDAGIAPVSPESEARLLRTITGILELNR